MVSCLFFFNAAIYLFQKFLSVTYIKTVPRFTSQHRHNTNTKYNTTKLLCSLPVMPGRHIHRLIYTRIPTSSHQAICIYKTFLFRFCSRKRCFIFIFSLYNLSESPPLAILPMLDDWNLSPDGAGQKNFGYCPAPRKQKRE